MKKVIGKNYLHTHPMEENAKGIDNEHCIVDKKELQEVQKFFEDNPELIHVYPNDTKRYEMKRENGYYWVKPATLSYKGKWVIATFENGMFWVHGTGEAYTDKDMSETDEQMIVRGDNFKICTDKYY